MIEKTLVVGSFQCNCRLWICSRTGEALVIDAGDEAARIIAEINRTQTPSGVPVRVKYLLHTHGHLDHIGATREVLESLQNSTQDKTMRPKVSLHRADEPLYQNLRTQGQMFGIEYNDPLPIDHYLEEGEELKVGDLKLSVIHTPGHSPGSVCIRLHEDSALGVRESLLSGDTLFQGSVGRTDLWGGDTDLMFKNIRQRILTLDEDTRVCPGHGPDTLIGTEKRKNPFLR